MIVIPAFAGMTGHGEAAHSGLAGRRGCDRMRAMAAKTLNLDQFLPYRLSIASNALSERIAEEYQSRFGLKIPEWRLMAVLGEGQPKTPRDLVAAPRMAQETVNRAAPAQRGS